MAYSEPGHVAALCMNLLSGGSTAFSTSSCPTLSNVQTWLSSGCAVIEGYLSGHRYSMPVASTAGAYSWLTNLNTLYAAAMAQSSRQSATIMPGERTVGRVYMDQFWSELKILAGLDLTTMGVTRSTVGKLYAGGISLSDKELYEDDTDRTPPKFAKGMFDFPGTIRPTVSTAS